jgi:sarcosine oxidase, subunit gamma
VADKQEQSALHRVHLNFQEICRADFSVQREQGLGIGKLQVWGPNAEAHFKALLDGSAPQPCCQTQLRELSIAWLAPGEWLIAGNEEDVAQTIAQITDRGGDEVLCNDLTHARAAFLISGVHARDALASHCPLDLSDASFCVNAVARSQFGSALMFIARLHDLGTGQPQFRVIVDQTLQPYFARMIAEPRHYIA